MRVLLGAALALVSFAVGAADPVPSCSISASPATGSGTIDVTVTWATQNAVKCLASGGWSGLKDCAGGSQILQVSQDRDFIMTVTAPLGRVGVKWTKPIFNTDGTPTTISGFKLYIADSPDQVASATPILLGADVQELTFYFPPGSKSFGIKATRSDGVDSQMSNLVSKTVVAMVATCSASVSVSSLPRAPTIS